MPDEPLYDHENDDLPDVWFRCLEAIGMRIRGLQLTGIEDNRVKLSKYPLAESVPKLLEKAKQQGVIDASPGLLVMPFQERLLPEQYAGLKRTNYRCRVAMFQGANQHPTAHLKTHLKWRNVVSLAFWQKVLEEVPENEQTSSEPGELYPIEGIMRSDLDSQGVIINCHCCEPV